MSRIPSCARDGFLSHLPLPVSPLFSLPRTPPPSPHRTTPPRLRLVRATHRRREVRSGQIYSGEAPPDRPRCRGEGPSPSLLSFPGAAPLQLTDEESPRLPRQEGDLLSRFVAPSTPPELRVTRRPGEVAARTGQDATSPAWPDLRRCKFPFPECSRKSPRPRRRRPLGRVRPGLRITWCSLLVTSVNVLSHLCQSIHESALICSLLISETSRMRRDFIYLH
jgi:hypothetical protein